MERHPEPIAALRARLRSDAEAALLLRFALTDREAVSGASGR